MDILPSGPFVGSGSNQFGSFFAAEGPMQLFPCGGVFLKKWIPNFEPFWWHHIAVVEHPSQI